MKKNFYLLVIFLGIFLISLIGTNCLAATSSDGLRVIPASETVYAQESRDYDVTMWRYKLLVFPTDDVTVNLEKFIRRFHHPDKDDYKTSQTYDEKQLEKKGFGEVSFDRPRVFRGRMDSKDFNTFIDYTFIGTDENGNEVKGTARIHYMQVKRENDVGPFD